MAVFILIHWKTSRQIEDEWPAHQCAAVQRLKIAVPVFRAVWAGQRSNCFCGNFVSVLSLTLSFSLILFILGFIYSFTLISINFTNFMTLFRQVEIVTSILFYKVGQMCYLLWDWPEYQFLLPDMPLWHGTSQELDLYRLSHHDHTTSLHLL